jgi:hypothetical protein
MVFVGSNLLSNRVSLILPRAVSHGAEFFEQANHPVALVTQTVPDPLGHAGGDPCRHHDRLRAG